MMIEGLSPDRGKVCLELRALFCDVLRQGSSAAAIAFGNVVDLEPAPTIKPFDPVFRGGPSLAAPQDRIELLVDGDGEGFPAAFNVKEQITVAVSRLSTYSFHVTLPLRWVVPRLVPGAPRCHYDFRSLLAPVSAGVFFW